MGCDVSATKVLANFMVEAGMKTLSKIIGMVNSPLCSTFPVGNKL